MLENRPAKAASSNQSDAPGLCFGSHQDALDFVGNGIENQRRWMATHEFRFSKPYEHSDLCLGVNLRAKTRAHSCDLVFIAVPFEHRGDDPANYLEIMKGGSPRLWGDRGENAVLCGVTELVKGPEGIIPSLVWLKAPEERFDVVGQISAPTPDVVLNIGGGVASGKFSASRDGDTVCECDSGPNVVESGSEPFDCLGCRDFTFVRDRLKKSDLVRLCNSVSVWLGEIDIYYGVHERLALRLESTGVFLCSLKTELGTSKEITFNHVQA
jgi:hypothetical protein